MKMNIGSTISPRAKRMILTLATFCALCTCALAIPHTAFAATQIESISESSCATQNSLLILDDPTYAKSELGLDITQQVSVKESNVVAHAVTNYIGNCWSRGISRQYAWTATELNEHLISYINADLGAADANGIRTSSYINSGVSFSIDPDRAWTDGDEWSATFTYPVVGTYNGVAVGAHLGMTGKYGRALNPTYDPETGVKSTGSSAGKARFDFSYPMVQLPNLLYAGGYFINAYDVTMTLEFFDAETGASVEMLNDDAHASYLSFNSQNYYPYNTTTGALSTNGSYGSWTEDIWLPKGNTSRIEIISGGNMSVKDNDGYYAAIPTSDSFTDVLGGKTYNYNRTTFYQTGSFSFLLPRRDSYTSGWFSFDSSTVGTARPVDPVKSVDRAYPTLGDTVTWTVEQQVHNLGETIGAHYESFAFTDTLPAGVSYKSAKMYCVIDGKATDITASAGTLSTSGRKVAYTFSSSYLDAMKLESETYRLVIETVVNTSATNDADLENTATVKINDWALDASAKTHPSWITVSKAWDDDGDDDARPDLIAISVKGVKGTPYSATGTIDKNFHWRASISVPRYNEDGTPAHYEVTEVVPEGYTCTVSGDAQSGYTITNALSYSGSAKVTAKKTLNGAEPGADHVFTFTLSDADTGKTIQTATNDEKGNIMFSPLNYTLDDLGEHRYTMSEADEGLDGIAYDDHVATFTVYVTKGDGGKLDCNVDYDEEEEPLFENFTATPITMPLAGQSGLLMLVGTGLAIIAAGVGAGFLLSRRHAGPRAAKPQWRPFDD